MLSVLAAEYLGDHKVHLSFNNGKAGIADLADAIKNDRRPVFLALQDKTQFQQFKVEHNTLVWPNTLDLAPEYLFFITFKTEDNLQDQFKQWGYLT